MVRGPDIHKAQVIPISGQAAAVQDQHRSLLGLRTAVCQQHTTLSHLTSMVQIHRAATPVATHGLRCSRYAACDIPSCSPKLRAWPAEFPDGTAHGYFRAADGV